ncbi:response regulator [Bacteroides sp. OttesenSCG-928-J23]|nr:response regulator [Bacteroides sp. OttesenSCG-928-J23]
MKQNSFLRLLTLVLFFSLVGKGNAHSLPPYTFTHYTAEHGLTQKTVSYILQDRKGYMWFATWDGLNKFDGYTFRNYKARPGNKIELPSNRIDFMAEDSCGYIWILNYGHQVYRFHPHSGEFQPIQYPSYSAKSFYLLPNGHVWITTELDGLIRVRASADSNELMADNFSQANNLLPTVAVNLVQADGQGNEWILSSNGLYRVNADDGSFTSYFVESLQSRHEQQQPFYNMAETGEDLFFSSNNGHVWRYRKQDGRFSLLELSTTSNIVTINTMSDNTLIAGSSDDGFFVIDTTTQNSKHFNTLTTPVMPGNRVKSVFCDSYNEVWISLSGKGVVHYNPHTDETRYHVMRDNAGKILDSQPAMLIHEDIRRNLWIHPAGGGFAYYDRTKKELIPFYNEKLQNGWSSSNRVSVTYSDKQGNLWISSYDNGLEKVTFHTSAFHLQTPNLSDYEAQENDVRTLFEDSRGQLWVATKDRTIAIYDQDMQLKGYLSNNGTISHRPYQLGMAYSMIEDSKNTIWIGTKGEGLIALEPRADERAYKLTQYRHNPRDIYSLSDNNIYCLHEDDRGRIWVATFGGGINYLERITEGETVFTNHRNHLKNYPINKCYRTRYITSDAAGNIWVGTTTGLLAFGKDFNNPEELTFNHFTRIPGDINSLSNNDVHSIYLAGNGSLYIGTFGGGLNKLLSYNNGQARFQSFTTAEGFPSDILLSITEDSGGNLWMNTEEEICKFNTLSQTIETYNGRFFPQRIKFNEGAAIRLASGKFAFNTRKGFLTFAPDAVSKSKYIPPIAFNEEATELVFSHKNNSFSLSYAALDLEYPEDIQYAYILEGFENSWNMVGKRRVATYTNIPKGQYILKVQSTNSDGIWTNNIRSLPIRILPSFWETPWAILLYVAGLVAIILIAVYVLFTFYRLKNEVAVEQQVSDIKLRFFTNVSHELRTPLTLIAGPVENLLEQYPLEDEVKEQLEVVERNTKRMLRLVNQILDFRKIQNGKMKMRVQQIEAVLFVRNVMENFRAIADNHQIEFTLQTDVDKLYLWADADKLEKILFNLLSNAFKYTPRGKRIRVVVYDDDASITISIKDQGVGIDPGKQKSIFVRFENLVDKNPFNQPTSGIGLSLTKELVEMHNGSIRIESRTGEGSNFIVNLPKGKGHFGEDAEFIVADVATAGNELPNSQPDDTVTNEPETDNTKETLLLVEDNAELRQFIKTLFADKFNILEAEDGETGYEKALEQSPDFIISDIMMPGETDGIELTQKLRLNMHTSHIPIILLTAKSNIESKLEGLEFGADDYITKPFSASYLKARVSNLLEQRKKLQKIYYANFIANPKNNADTPKLCAADQKFIDKLMELMNVNMDNGELLVDDLADSLSLSRSVFFKKLKSLTGLSPIEFIKEVRIKRATELICEGGLNMSQIAYAVGFNDPHYFSKCFKQVTGLTPSEYKAKAIS